MRCRVGSSGGEGWELADLEVATAGVAPHCADPAQLEQRPNKQQGGRCKKERALRQLYREPHGVKQVRTTQGRLCQADRSDRRLSPWAAVCCGPRSTLLGFALVCSLAWPASSW